MPTFHTVTAYPVANGDTCQIVLANGRRVLLDFCHRDKAESSDADSSTVGQRIALHLSSESQDCEQVIAGP
jgi:hypothetical protein